LGNPNLFGSSPEAPVWTTYTYDAQAEGEAWGQIFLFSKTVRKLRPGRRTDFEHRKI